MHGKGRPQDNITHGLITCRVLIEDHLPYWLLDCIEETDTDCGPSTLLKA